MVEATLEIQEATGAGVSDDVVEQFKEDLLALKDHVKSKLMSMANVLHRMSRKQICEIKKFAKTCDMSSNLIDNLCLCGSGEMSIELAMHPCRIGNRLFRSLPLAEKAKLNDLSTPIPMVTKRGLIVKTVGELNAFEIKEVVQVGVGILSADKQTPIFAKIAPSQKRVDKSAVSAFLFDGFNVTSEKEVLLFGRDSGEAPGTRTICIKLTAAEWKRLRASR